jgi:hypothetical protein
MSVDPVVILFGVVSGLGSLCCCVFGAGAIAHARDQITVTIVHNPTQSVGSDEPEDPVDFSSKPKSSATSFGS